MRSVTLFAATFALASWLAGTPPAAAVSFSCLRASNLVENLICSNPDLSELDDRMAAAYAAARRQAGNPSALVQAQREWLRQRDACRDVPCIEHEYQVRLAELGDVASGPGRE